jgi:hypothetical protein
MPLRTIARTITSFLAPDPAICLAGCQKPHYKNLIVTKCNHIFCRSCLQLWLLKDNKECPLDRAPLLDMNTEEGKKEYTSFKTYLEKFSYYISHDFLKLQEKLAAEKVLSIANCQLLKARKSSSEKKDVDESDDQCAICQEIPFQMYFITQDKDSTKIGCHMHEDCWQSKVDKDSIILDISVHDIVKVSEQLPWPPKEYALGPIKPASPVRVFFVAIILPVSIWALAMNIRLYHNKNAFLYVLSIPALVIFKILSLFLNGVKALFLDKPA